jgi:hypothetical protein
MVKLLLHQLIMKKEKMMIMVLLRSIKIRKLREVEAEARSTETEKHLPKI